MFIHKKYLNHLLEEDKSEAEKIAARRSSIKAAIVTGADDVGIVAANLATKLSPEAMMSVGAVGALAAFGSYKLYKYLSDPCKNKADIKFPNNNIKRMLFTNKCNIEAAKKVINRLTASKKHCERMGNPKNCSGELNKKIVEFNGKIENLSKQNYTYVAMLKK